MSNPPTQTSGFRELVDDPGFTIQTHSPKLRSRDQKRISGRTGRASGREGGRGRFVARYQSGEELGGDGGERGVEARREGPPVAAAAGHPYLTGDPLRRLVLALDRW